MVSPAARKTLTGGDERPHPAWALVVGCLYIFRTRPGAKLRRDLERAVRRYAADPAALWRLMREGERVKKRLAGTKKPAKPGG